MSGLVRRRGYLCREVALDATAFLGGQSQFGLLAHFVILAHSSRRSRAMRDDDARGTKMRPRDGGLVSHGDRAMRLGDLRYSNLESLFKKREKGTKPWYLVCLIIKC